MDYYDHKKVVTEDGRQNLVEFSLKKSSKSEP